jgi:hypothetical protein
VRGRVARGGRSWPGEFRERRSGGHGSFPSSPGGRTLFRGCVTASVRSPGCHAEIVLVAGTRVKRNTWHECRGESRRSRRRASAASLLCLREPECLYAYSQLCGNQKSLKDQVQPRILSHLFDPLAPFPCSSRSLWVITFSYRPKSRPLKEVGPASFSDRKECRIVPIPEHVCEREVERYLTDSPRKGRDTRRDARFAS